MAETRSASPSSGGTPQDPRHDVGPVEGGLGAAPGRGDLVAMLALAAVSTLAWCTANDRWSLAAMQVPTAYMDPEKSDVMHALAMMKAGARGEFLPLVWKQVSQLGAPEGANWNDWPMVEELLVGCFALLARTFGLFAGLNIAALLGTVLACLSFYVVARLMQSRIGWAFVGALAFGLAPFIFAQQPFHITCEWVWQIPWLTLVWRWVSTEPGIVPGSPRFWPAVCIGLVVGLLNPYYTNILCQLTLLGAAIQYARGGSRPALLGALAVIGAAAVAFLVMNLDTWSYGWVHGRNPAALSREYKWLEIYGLKIKDLFIPPPTHHSELFAAFSLAHRRAAPLLDEAASYQGIVGLACLLWLVGTAVLDMVQRRERDVPMEAWQVLWVVLMFTTGGLNAIAGVLGFTVFRGGSRYAIVILAIALMYAVRRLSAIQSRSRAADLGPETSILWNTALAAIAAIVLWDQVPRAPTREETDLIARQVGSDRDFTGRMEAALPEAAMVFQLPVMEFPEVPGPNMPPYDHFRPYLYSDRLRYSFGSVKGRPREDWQRELGQLIGWRIDPNTQQFQFACGKENLARLVEEIRRRGFSGLYLNRNGFPDRARCVDDAMLELGYTKPPIRSAMGDLACFVLQKD